MDLILQDKASLVTGAAGPMGAAVVKKLISQGCTVAMVDINVEGLCKNADEFGEKAHTFVADIESSDSVQGMYAEVERELGGGRHHGKWNFTSLCQNTDDYRTAH